MTEKEDDKKAIFHQIDELMLAIRKQLNKSMLLTANRKLPAIPQPKCLIGGKLKDYQLESLAWMIQLANNNLSGILADDMGLGKTIQAISYMSYLYEVKGIKGKHIIVVPKNVLNNWKRELQNWNPIFRVVILPGTEIEREQVLKQYVRPSKFDILIATYQSVQMAQRNLKPFHWETFIVDEAHSIKNDESFLASCLRRFNYKFTLLLTGTPLSNQLKQLWSLLNFVAPKIFFNGTLFKRIEDTVNLACTDEEEKLRYQSEIAAKFKAIISPFLMRRVKNQINLGLKEKKQFTLFISLTELQLKMYRNYLKYHSVYGVDTGYQASSHMQLRKICAHPYLFSDIQDPSAPPYGEHLIENSGKMKLLDKLLAKLLKQKHKILIFSQFVIFLKLLEDYCTYRGYKYATITGDSSLQDRDQSVQRFSKSEDTNLFLISTRAGGIGLNLVAADVVILYDMDWNPQMDRQATDRAYRIGQKNSVKVFKLISINTIEERMLQVQKYKIIWDQLVIQKGGLARLKAAQQKFEKLDQNKIAGLDAEEIFKLQQNFDDKTIDQIIKMGQQKDKKKTDEIKARLQKQFQSLGQIANPFENLQNKSCNLDDIDYQAEQIGHIAKKKSAKMSWKERVEQKQIKKQARTKPYQMFSNLRQAEQILQLMSQTQDQQMVNQGKKKLGNLGFYNWSKKQYQKFITANQMYHKQEYKKIAEEIGTKNHKEVEKYSNQFYSKAEGNPQLNKDLKKIMKKQQQFEKKVKIDKAKQKIKSYPGPIFNLKPKSPVSDISNQSLIRMYFNQIKQEGICLQEQQDIIKHLNPVAYRRIQRNVNSVRLQMTSLDKVIDNLDSKSQKKIYQQLQKRYQALESLYLPKKKTKQVQIVDLASDDSMTTAIKPLHS